MFNDINACILQLYRQIDSAIEDTGVNNYISVIGTYGDCASSPYTGSCASSLLGNEVSDACTSGTTAAQGTTQYKEACCEAYPEALVILSATRLALHWTQPLAAKRYSFSIRRDSAASKQKKKKNIAKSKFKDKNK